MDFEFCQVPYHTWGPWRNQWGYITTVAQFDEDDILLKSTTPSNKQIIKRYSDWEQCQMMIELIEQDRRF